MTKLFLLLLVSVVHASIMNLAQPPGIIFAECERAIESIQDRRVDLTRPTYTIFGRWRRRRAARLWVAEINGVVQYCKDLLMLSEGSIRLRIVMDKERLDVLRTTMSSVHEILLSAADLFAEQISRPSFPETDIPNPVFTRDYLSAWLRLADRTSVPSPDEIRVHQSQMNDQLNRFLYDLRIRRDASFMHAAQVAFAPVLERADRIRSGREPEIAQITEFAAAIEALELERARAADYRYRIQFL
jgi:hypothetical protein